MTIFKSMYWPELSLSGAERFYESGQIVAPVPLEFYGDPECLEILRQCSTASVIDRWPICLAMGTGGQPSSMSNLNHKTFPLDALMETEELAAEVDGHIIPAVGSAYIITSISNVLRYYKFTMINDTDFTFAVELNGAWLPFVEQRFYGELLALDTPAMLAAYIAQPNHDENVARQFRRSIWTGVYPPGTFAFDTFYFRHYPYQEQSNNTDRPENFPAINLVKTSWVDFQRQGLVGLVGRSFMQPYSYVSNIYKGFGHRLVNQPVKMPDGSILYDGLYDEPDWTRSIAEGPNASYEKPMPYHQSCDRSYCVDYAPRRKAAYKKGENGNTAVLLYLRSYPPCLQRAIQKCLMTLAIRANDQDAYDAAYLETLNIDQDDRDAPQIEEDRLEQLEQKWLDNIELATLAKLDKLAKIESDRLVAEQAERDRLARLEQERQFAERAEQNRLAKLEKQRAAEQIELDRLARLEQERQFAEQEATHFEDERIQGEMELKLLEDAKQMTDNPFEQDDLAAEQENVIVDIIDAEIARQDAKIEAEKLVADMLDSEAQTIEVIGGDVDSEMSAVYDDILTDLVEQEKQIEVLIEEKAEFEKDAEKKITTATTTTVVETGLSTQSIVIIMAIVAVLLAVGVYLYKRKDTSVSVSSDVMPVENHTQI